MLLFSRLTTWLLIAVLAGLAVALLYWPLTALFAHIPLSYNEGWNGFHSLRLRTGGSLYPPVDAATFINYPPLSFYLTAAIAGLTGDDIVAGRILALAALAITTLNVGLAARRLGAARRSPSPPRSPSSASSRSISPTMSASMIRNGSRMPSSRRVSSSFSVVAATGALW